MEELESLYFGLKDKHTKINTRHFYVILVCLTITLLESGGIDEDKHRLLLQLDKYKILGDIQNSLYWKTSTLKTLLADIPLMELDIFEEDADIIRIKKIVLVNILDFLFVDGKLSDTESSLLHSVAVLWKIPKEWLLNAGEIIELKYGALPYSDEI